MSRLVDVNKLKEALIKEYLRGKKTLMEVIDEQPTVKMKDSQNDIANIIYNALDHMYCDNCRFSSEIKESDSDEWSCDECHRKYNGWGVSMQESNRIAKEILKQLGE
jgi:ribosomal protein L37AE/L43A|nr:MAG TPA: PROTEIN/RNA Complex ribosomal subunit, ribonucleoprotein, ribosomal [Caudoviricetes sp.]